LLKTLGLILIFISGSGIGFRASYNLQLRLEQMKQIQGMLIRIKGELRYSHQPISIILNNTSKKTVSPFQEVTAKTAEELELHNGDSLNEIWEQAISNYQENLYLTKGERQLFCELGMILGYFDKELQMNQLDLQLEEWGRRIEALEMELHSNIKLYRSLGVMGSILTIIILL
jgi:stage III sporulation protein AB